MSFLSELNFSFKEVVTAFMVLFAVIDIIGNIPIIIDLRKKSRAYSIGKSGTNCRYHHDCFFCLWVKVF